MIRASRHFTDEQRQRVNSAVVEAEVKTSAQIVPVVASASGRYDRAEDVAGLWAGAIAAGCVFVFVGESTGEPGDWSGVDAAVKLAVMAAALVGGFTLGAMLASYIWAVRRLFTPRSQMRSEVDRAARAAFYDASIHSTTAGTGVLIYISLYERRAAVLTDAAVQHAVGPEAIDAWCAKLTAALAVADETTALRDAIDEIGAALAPLMPRGADDANELPDALVTID